MSILLNALKKSEAQRQLGQTPDIHSSAEQPPADDDTGRSLTPVLLVVIAGLLIGWFVWQQYREPDVLPDYGEPENSVANEYRVIEGEGKLQSEATASAANQAMQSAGPGDVAQNRTPVESYQEEVQPSAISRRPVSETDGDRQELENLNRSFSNYQAEEPPELSAAQARAAQSQSSAPRSAQSQRNAPRPGPDSRPGSGAREQSATHSEVAGREESQTEPISYWQLPQSLREGLPELKVSVLVYADDPADRFVLVNGLRLVEKEEIAAGVLVEEIRRDGVVISYRNYRFLFKS